MNLAHLHIVLNHVPTLGTLFGVALLIWSMIRKSEHWNKTSLQILVVMALLALPTYLSGNAAQWLLQNRTEIPQVAIEAHENSAMITLALMTVTGTLAWFGLWQYRRFSRPGAMNQTALALFSIVTAVFIMQTANLGGKISHPEVRYEEIAGEVTGGWRAPISGFANSHSWVWPASETLHFIGMMMLFGVALAVTMRMLGMMKSVPFSALHRLLPLGILGFIVNVVTGMVFFIASPEMYVLNMGFVLKILFIILAGIIVIYFTLFEEPWIIGPEKTAPVSAKVFAVCTVALLLGAMYFGRMLPFLRN
jgi:uncharacterized membrane protein